MSFLAWVYKGANGMNRGDFIRILPSGCGAFRAWRKMRLLMYHEVEELLGEKNIFLPF